MGCTPNGPRATSGPIFPTSLIKHDKSETYETSSTHTLKESKAMIFKPNITARILTSILLALAVPRQLIAAGPAPVNLRSTADFAILAGAAITSTGGGTINGNVGASPIAGSAIGVTTNQVKG